MLNKIILMGRLVRDPEFKTTPSGVSVVLAYWLLSRLCEAAGLRMEE